MKLLNTKTEEEYMFVPSGDGIISWKRSEWLEIPVHRAKHRDMLPRKLLTTCYFGAHIIFI